ncbi:MAG: hypothetical protein NTW31_12325 [Bacteroidetes bacterium]|nr:hypothetical protein [Bacteroidota bacterium]
MKTILRRMMPVAMVLVFVIYGYSQNASTTTTPVKETKTAQCGTACAKFIDKNGDGICDMKKDGPNSKGKSNGSEKEMKDCKVSCSDSHSKSGCAAKSAGCAKDNAKMGCCQGQGSTSQSTSPGKTAAPTK